MARDGNSKATETLGDIDKQLRTRKRAPAKRSKPSNKAVKLLGGAPSVFTPSHGVETAEEFAERRRARNARKRSRKLIRSQGGQACLCSELVS